MKKILVVDDDEDVLVLMKAFLVRKGYDIMVSKSCNEGIGIFYSFVPDLVILDINVGSEDGREMCKTIKTHAGNQHIPVLLISANSHALTQYPEYGANGIIEKPVEISSLLDMIRTHLK